MRRFGNLYVADSVNQRMQAYMMELKATGKIINSVPGPAQPNPSMQRPQRGLHRIEWNAPDEVEFQLGHGDWIDVLRANGFEIERLVELFAADDAVDHGYYHTNAEWAKKWPSEEVWRARLSRR